jgi:hypothetical protein
VQTVKAVIPDRHLFFWVAYYDIPNSPNPIVPERVFAAVRDGVAAQMHLKVEGQRRIHIDGFPGLEVTFNAAHDTVFRMRFYLIGRRFYQVQTGTVRANAAAPELPRFFDSFRLLKR